MRKFNAPQTAYPVVVYDPDPDMADDRSPELGARVVASTPGGAWMPPRSFHRLSALVVIATAISNLVACAPTTPTSPTKVAPTPAPVALTVGVLASAAAAPIIVPSEEGQFEARGLNVSLELETDTAQTMQSIATGQYDIGYAGMGSAVLNAFHREIGLKIIAAGAAQPSGHGDNLSVIVRTALIDSGAVKTTADLKGRKIAINGLGGPEYKLAKALSVGGLTNSDVDIQLINYPNMVAALSSGAIDAGLLIQPIGAQAVANGVGKVLLDDYDQNGQGGLVFASTHLLTEHPAAVTSFLEVYLQAVRRLSNGQIKNDDKALTALEHNTNVLPAVIRLGSLLAQGRPRPGRQLA
jgi:NitT/TauT family transport system substrate-binding protein